LDEQIIPNKKTIIAQPPPALLQGFPIRKQPAWKEVKGEGETGCKASVRVHKGPERLN